jgi:hypothetical protein
MFNVIGAIMVVVVSAKDNTSVFFVFGTMNKVLKTTRLEFKKSFKQPSFCIWTLLIPELEGH